MFVVKQNWLVVALSAAGVVFILLGMMALAIPAPQEGIHIYQLGNHHAFYLMDIAGIFTLGLGVILTWLGGQLWTRQLHT